MQIPRRLAAASRAPPEVQVVKETALLGASVRRPLADPAVTNANEPGVLAMIVPAPLVPRLLLVSSPAAAASSSTSRWRTSPSDRHTNAGHLKAFLQSNLPAAPVKRKPPSPAAKNTATLPGSSPFFPSGGSSPIRNPAIGKATGELLSVGRSQVQLLQMQKNQMFWR